MIRLLLLLVLGCVLRDLLAMFCLIHYTRKCGGLVDLVKNHQDPMQAKCPAGLFDLLRIIRP